MAVNDEGRYFTWAGIPIPLALIGVGLWFWAIAAYPPLHEKQLYATGAVIGLTIAVVYIAIATMRVRGEPNWQGRVGIVAVMAALGWGALGVGAAMVANGLLAGTATETHFAKITEIRIVQQKRGLRHYEFEVESWIPGRTREFFVVRKKNVIEILDKVLVQGQDTPPMKVVTREGGLGVPLIESAELADGPIPQADVAPTEVAVAAPAVAPDGPLEWNSGKLVWFTAGADAWKESQATKKVMFVLFHNADPAAHQALLPMLTSAEAASVIEKCVPLRFDLTDPAGQTEAAKYGVTQVPTLMVIDLAGKPKGQVLVDLAAAPTWEKAYGQLRASAAGN